MGRKSNLLAGLDLPPLKDYWREINRHDRAVDAWTRAQRKARDKRKVEGAAKLRLQIRDGHPPRGHYRIRGVGEGVRKKPRERLAAFPGFVSAPDF